MSERAAGLELSNPLDPSSTPTGDTIFVLEEVDVVVEDAILRRLFRQESLFAVSQPHLGKECITQL